MSDLKVEKQRSVPDWAVGLPVWATEDFLEFYEHLRILLRLLDLSRQGIGVLQYMAEMAELVNPEAVDLPEKEEELKRAVEISAVAKTQVNDEFSLFHDHFTVALWSSLGALVRSFAAAWLANWPGAWKSEALRKLKVRLGDYESLDPDERCLWVIDLLDQETSGPLKQDVSRFENLLESFNLNGSVSEDCRKTLFELSQVRHVIVHRRGKADRKLIGACPWLNLKAGDKIKISPEMWRAYAREAFVYAQHLIRRVRVAARLSEHWNGDPKTGKP